MDTGSESKLGNYVEPIAIIGFALKFPQDVTSEERLWTLLLERRATLTEVPSNRWNLNGFYKTHGNQPGTVMSRGGHFISDDPARFDAPFFSIQPAEAECMDPQQRFLLETSYHALENAGIPMFKAMGSKTSVHVGCLLQEYSQISQRDSEMPGNYQIVGSSGLSMLANRLSWFYDFLGPSMTVDTACSGSLLAVHLACQDLLAGNVDMALACGSNLSLVPDSTALLSALNMMSPDSTCYSFDERANGYSRSEGFGVVILKRLSQAISDGDTIRGIVRATGCNQDGHTPGITQPSQAAQERLTKQTYSRAGLDMSVTRYFEAHGPGTKVGDPIEAGAISNAFTMRSTDDPLYVGALKSNIGHQEAASGIAGIIKTVLVLESGIIPPNKYPERILPYIAENCPNLKFALQATAWPTDGIRRSSINSFGYGGTNVHIVLDDALSYLTSHNITARHLTRPTISANTNGSVRLNGHKEPETVSNAKNNDDVLIRVQAALPYKLLVLSAFDERATQRSAVAFQEWLNTHAVDENVLEDLAFTLASKRSSFAWKTFSVASPELLDNLSWADAGRPKAKHRICYIFTGQGAQWRGMGQELCSYEIFRESLAAADNHLNFLGSGYSILSELYGNSAEDAQLNLPELSQPVCTILQIALVDLLASWNVEPSVAVGHSSGEIAAAYATGAISRESAWEIAYYRGLAVAIGRDLKQTEGSMIAVQATPEVLVPCLDEQNADHPSDIVEIACYNSPLSLTVAGSDSAIKRLTEILKTAGVRFIMLNIGVAYHSRHMRSVAQIYDRLLRPIEPGRAQRKKIPFVSSVTGKRLENTSVLQTSKYWQDNLTQPVEFATAVDKVCSDASDNGNKSLSADIFVEVGPHCTLKIPVSDILKAHGRDVSTDYVSALVRDQRADHSALTCAGKLHTWGIPVDLIQVNQANSLRRNLVTTLPPYPFNDKTRYWLEGRTSTQYRFRSHVHHDFLGTRVDDWNECEARWTNRIVLSQATWLKDHLVNGLTIYPAAGFMVMALEAARQIYGGHNDILGYKMRDIKLPKAVSLAHDNRGTELQLTLRTAHSQSESSKTPNSWDYFTIFVYEHDNWVECCSGAISVEHEGHHFGGTVDERADYMQTISQATTMAKSGCYNSVDVSEIYDAFEKAGLDYGPYFQGLQEVKCNSDGHAVASVPLQGWKARLDSQETDSHIIHPTALDAILQTSFPAYSIRSKNASVTTVPTGFRSAWFSADLVNVLPDSNVLVHAKVAERGFRKKVFSITAVLGDDHIPCFIGDMETSTIGSGTESVTAIEKPLYKIEYKPDYDLLPARMSTLQPHPDRNSDLIHDKERLCVASMRNALDHIDGIPGFLPIHLQEYVQWMSIKVGQSKALDKESIEEMCQRIEHIDVESRLLVRVARNLPDILSGKVDPLNLLFADDILSDFYSNFHSNQLLLSKAAEEIDLLAHKFPAMRVLEIGAGTGSATEHVLRALGDRVEEFVYTDVTPSFFVKARQRFPSLKVTFKTLDISTDPLQQGFKANDFDLIIAANVLHAANGIQNALVQCRTLLRPGGRIALLEMTNRQHLLEPYIFGLLPGLSREASPESARNNSPLLTESEWGKVLCDTGFSGLDVCVTDAGWITEESISAVMVSKAVVPSSTSTFELKVILDDSSTKQKDLVKALGEVCSNEHVAIESVPWETVLGSKLTQPTCLFLADENGTMLEKLQGGDLAKIKHIVSNCRTVIWTTIHAPNADSSPSHGLVPGLIRTLAAENDQCCVISLSLDASQDTDAAIGKILQVTSTLQQPRGVPEDEYVEIGGKLHVPRVVKDVGMSETTYSAHCTVTKPWRDLESPRLTMGTVGRLNTLYFEQNNAPPSPLGEEDVVIQVKAVGLSSRDLNVAQGQVHDETFGTQCAGQILRVGSSPSHNFKPGDRVFGVARDALAKECCCKAFQLQRLPSGMDFCEVASFPAAYYAAYYALIQCARIRTGQRVMVHQAAGEVGQAIIQLAQLQDCEVFATVDLPEHADFLQKSHGIPLSHTFSTQSLDFGNGINRLTNGEGVDVVINTLKGDAVRQSWESLASFGRLVNVGEVQVPTLPNGKNRMCIGIDLAELLESPVGGEVLTEVAKLVEINKLKPKNVLQIYNQNELALAFRALQDDLNTDRVAVEILDDAVVSMTLDETSRATFDPNASYLLTGGFGGIGQSLSRWLVRNGVKHLILPSRTPITEGTGSEREALIQELRAKGANVRAPFCDITSKTQLQQVLDEMGDMPPIKGCIQAAMNVRDSSFMNMPLDDWHASLSPKVAGSWNLHELLPSNLDFFIFFSSSTGIMGSFGQSNYTAGNTYQDALAAHRMANGQHAISLAFSMVVGAGWVAENAQVQALLRARGMLEEVSMDDIYELLRFCCDPAHNMGVGPQIITPLALPADMRALGIVEPLGSTRPIYSHLHTLPSKYTATSTGTTTQEKKILPSVSLPGATSLQDATEIITDAIQAQLSSLLVVSKEDIDVSKPIHKYGVDSLVAVEMRNWFSKGVGADVGTREILGEDGIGELAGKVAMRSKYVKEELKG